MIRNVLIAVLMSVLLINISYADIKIIQKTTNDTNFEIPTNNDIPPEVQQLMKKSLPGSSSKVVTYIKGAKQRVDYPDQEISTITLCEKKEIIELNHKNKTYAIESLDDELSFKNFICKPFIDPTAPVNSDPNVLTMKIHIKDTGKTEEINGYKAKKYIRETSIDGNPECMANTHSIEKLWVIDLENEDFQCPALKPYQNCQIPPDPAPCFKNANIIRSGVNNIPGLAIRTITRVDLPDEAMGEFADPSTDMATDDDPDAQNILFAQEKYSETRKTGGQLIFKTEIESISKDPLPDNLFEIPVDYTQSAILPAYKL